MVDFELSKCIEYLGEGGKNLFYIFPIKLNLTYLVHDISDGGQLHITLGGETHLLSGGVFYSMLCNYKIKQK